jgi:hypothetical protein
METNLPQISRKSPANLPRHLPLILIALLALAAAAK